MTFSETIKHLKSLEATIQSLKEKLETINAYGIKAQEFDGVQNTHSYSDAMANMLIKKQRTEETLLKVWCEYFDLQTNTFDRIDKLLPSREASIVTAKHLHHKSFKEISTSMGMSESYVKGLSSRACKELERLW